MGGMKHGPQAKTVHPGTKQVGGGHEHARTTGVKGILKSLQKRGGEGGNSVGNNKIKVGNTEGGGENRKEVIMKFSKPQKKGGNPNNLWGGQKGRASIRHLDKNYQLLGNEKERGCTGKEKSSNVKVPNHKTGS